ncbi:hypothetical protein EV177_006770 [Coemansia sp. RSA 1804]|nr:hypothetical protein EV177_006770 [Coemansia sp. RSA 1804]
MELVRKIHADTRFTAEALVITCFSTLEPGHSWVQDCLSLGWPGVYVVEIESNVCNVESDAQAIGWLRAVQDTLLFPVAQIYRLKVHWAGCTEVFEHPLSEELSRTLVKRNIMSAMSRSEQGAVAMYTYLTYIFKSDIFEPRFVELIDAQPRHIQTILDTINKNASHLVYSDMRAITSNAGLQSSLRHICLDMHNMNDSRFSLPFCSAHFPKLGSLVINHSPDFKSDNPNIMPTLNQQHSHFQRGQNEDGEVQGIPGPMSLDSFTIFPKNRNMRVLRMPYLQIPFSVGLALLKDIPQLQILEFAPVLKHIEPKSPSITSTLRRRVSASLSPQFNAPFADSDVVYHLKSTKHPLKDMILHGACTTRFISTSWIEVMNSLVELATVTFIAVSPDDIAAADRVAAFCARNGARFGIEIDNRSRRHQTCLDFASSWGKMGDLLWKK